MRLNNNSGSTGAYIDVYTMSLSFYEALVWDTIQPSTALVDFNLTAGPPDTQGNVSLKDPLPLFTENTYKNLNFTSHYLKHQGTVYVSSEDGSAGQTTIEFPFLPSKNKRQQTGSFYGVVLHNSSLKNNAETLNIDASLEISFMEIPSDNRLPFIY